jgi:hypothetical protein
LENDDEVSVTSEDESESDEESVAAPDQALQADVEDSQTGGMAHGLGKPHEDQLSIARKESIDLLTKVLDLQNHMAELSTYCGNLKAELVDVKSHLQASEAASALQAELASMRAQELEEASDKLCALQDIRVGPGILMHFVML